MPSTETALTREEVLILEKFRRAKEARHATLEVHVQDGVVVHINLTEKFRPKLNE